ncbi:tyrosine-type recombinase/integrase [Rhizobium sp. RAF56]|uniref:tyrosine-type recombinase/integrase n=1 Tax=Rhizobium sp. RAF56 TaxID=3233062 RepID=UPI003F9E5200
MLNRVNVKKLTCEAGKTETLHRDSELSGFILRCYANGKRVYLVQYRNAAGQTRRLNIGPAETLEADEARALAKKALAKVVGGEDPAEARQEIRQAPRFGDLVTGYLEYAATTQRPSTLAETTRGLNVHALSLHTTAIRDIKRADIAALHDKIGNDIGKIVANRVLAALSSFFAWCIGRGAVEVNPVTAMPRNVETPRERTLSDDEIRKLWKASASSDDFSRIVRILLLTGTRRTEVGGMEWSEFSETPAGKIWTIPGARSKNGLPLETPLGDLALSLLPERKERRYVFGRLDTGFTGWSKSKAAFNKRAGLSDWGLHDLRRTFSTRMNDDGIALPHIVEAMLNHVSGHKSGVSGTYNRALYRDQKREALAKWEALVQQIAKGDE